MLGANLSEKKGNKGKSGRSGSLLGETGAYRL